MTAEHREDRPLGLSDVLLMPIRLPQRIVSDIETIMRSLLSLQRSIEPHLDSIDERSAALERGLDALRGPLDRVDEKIGNLHDLEDEVTQRIDVLQQDVKELLTTVSGGLDAIRDELNTRMLTVEQEVRAMRGPMERMARDVENITELLPEPNDGPLTRLKDTLARE